MGNEVEMKIIRGFHDLFKARALQIIFAQRVLFMGSLYAVGL